jgi:hypothetical protein
MPSDYESITTSNIERLGTDTRSRRSQVNLYSKPTHFIYELLQNADDYGATSVIFKLTPEALIVEHNGIPFETENVKAISYFENSTSAADVTKTGRFGLGFKSVFAFTATPQIFSGDECFEISGLYRLNALKRPEGLGAEITRIVLPFNHEEMRPDYVERIKNSKDAYDEIAGKLEDIKLTSLLFTKSIVEVRWSHGDRVGHYLKECRADNLVYVASADAHESYLVYSRELDRFGVKPLSVAFRLDDGHIVGINNRSLFVLFETELETHLGFLVNGDFRTTPSRENIKYEDNVNAYLIKQLAELVLDCIESIKQRGLLNVEFLECLPIRVKSDEDGIWGSPRVGRRWKPDYPENWAFMPVYEAVKDLLRREAFLPTDVNGIHSTAEGAFLARGEELRSLFPARELEHIWGKPKVWLCGDITADKTPELRDYLMHALGVQEVDPPTLLSHLSSDALFRAQTEEWLIQFYLYVSKENNRRSAVQSKKVPCLPLTTGEWVAYKEKNVVFADSLECTSSKGIAYLKFDWLLGSDENEHRAEVYEFLKSMGVHELGEADQVKSILAEYYDRNQFYMDLETHLAHMRTFISYWKHEEWRARDLLASKPIFCVDAYAGLDVDDEENGAVELVFLSAEQCYIDQPLANTMLSEVLSADSGSSKKALSSGYKMLGNEFLDFTKYLGVQYRLEPVKSNVLENPLIVQVGGTNNPSCPRVDWQLPPFIMEVLELDVNADKDVDAFDLKFQVASLVWDMMNYLGSNARHYFRAQYQKNKHQTKQSVDSMLIQQLTELRWLLKNDKNVSWCTPQELTKDWLYTGADAEGDSIDITFDVDTAESWLKLVKFGQSEEKLEAAKILGVDCAEVEFLKQFMQECPGVYHEWKESRQPKPAETFQLADISESLKKSMNKPGAIEIDEKFQSDDGVVNNPDRRETRAKEEIQEKKEAEPHPDVRRTVRLTNSIECKGLETRNRLLEWYGGKCQICEHTWAKRNGEPYFNAAYLIEVKDGRWLDCSGNALSLCADHFAQWRHAAKEELYDVQEWVLQQKLFVEGGDGSLVLEFMLLGERVRIKYCEKHFVELRALVRNCAESIEQSSVVPNRYTSIEACQATGHYNLLCRVLGEEICNERLSRWVSEFNATEMSELFNVIATLSSLEQEVLTLRFGLVDGEPLTLGQVAKKCNSSHERIRRLEAKALRKMRHPVRIGRLDPLLEEYGFA